MDSFNTLGITDSAYDAQNIFARILRQELPCQRVMESTHTLAFYDIAPVAPLHILLIPKGAYINAEDFYQRASEAEILDWSRTLAQVIAQIDLSSGYRLVSNAGRDGGQVVPHFHTHILGGRALGSMG